MKNLYVLLLLIVTSSACFGQNIELTPNSSDSLSTSSALTEEEKSKLYIELKSIENHIKAIETKRNFIKIKPEDMKIAESQNWFAEMEKIEKKLIERKRQINYLLN